MALLQAFWRELLRLHADDCHTAAASLADRSKNHHFVGAVCMHVRSHEEFPISGIYATFIWRLSSTLMATALSNPV